MVVGRKTTVVDLNDYEAVRLAIEEESQAWQPHIEQYGPVGDRLVVKLAFHPRREETAVDFHHLAVEMNSSQNHLPIQRRTYYGDLSLHARNPAFNDAEFRREFADLL